MFELKPISKESLPRSLEKAERYRLLNEPRVAESICRDILQIEPQNQSALITLILALTDQFGNAAANPKPVLELIAQLGEEYERRYYTGIVYERQGKAKLIQNVPGAGFDAYDLLHEAMTWFEQAEAIHPRGNDDAILRWNTCARLLMSDPKLVPEPDEAVHTWLE